MRTSIALPDDRPRVVWASVARDVPRAIGLLGAVLVILVLAGLMTP